MRSSKRNIQTDPTLITLVVIAVLVLGVLAILLGKTFFSANNFQSMAYQIPEFGFLALAMTLTMLTGGIDLSAVANANLSGILAAYFLSGAIIKPESGISEGWLIIIAVAAALLVSTLCGLFNGFLIAKVSIPPILATLGTMTFYSGIGMAITEGKGVVGFPESFLAFGTAHLAGVPYIFIVFLLAVILVSVVLGKTPRGKSIYLFGENHTASLFSGIENEKLTLIVYALAGLLAGCASIIIITRVNSAKVGYGDTYLLQAILVAVLGGIDPNGGRGRVFGVILGIIILQALQSAFTLFTFTPYAKKLIWGFMLLVVMIINYIIDVRRARVRSPEKNRSPALQEGS